MSQSILSTAHLLGAGQALAEKGHESTDTSLGYYDAYGKWIGSFKDCSNRARGRIVNRIGRLKYRKYDFPDFDFERGTLEDAVAKAFMEYQRRKHQAQTVFSKKNLQELMEMSKKDAKAVVPPSIRQKIKNGEDVDGYDLKGFTKFPY